MTGQASVFQNDAAVQRLLDVIFALDQEYNPPTNDSTAEGASSAADDAAQEAAQE